MALENYITKLWFNIPAIVLGGYMAFSGFSNAVEIKKYNKNLELMPDSKYSLLNKEVDRLDSLINVNIKKIKENPDSTSFYKNENYELLDKMSNIVSSKDYAESKNAFDVKKKEEKSNTLYILLLFGSSVPLAIGITGLGFGIKELGQ